MKTDLPKRKPIRLSAWDYHNCGVYFITLCTKDRKNLFWSSVGATIGRPQDVPLSACGKTVTTAIQNISKHYPSVTVDNFVVMPNHVHLLLRILCDENGRPMVAPTISTVIQQTKGFVTKQIGFPLWQKLFYDHVVRNDADYRECFEYIETNPAKWTLDHLFSET